MSFETDGSVGCRMDKEFSSEMENFLVEKGFNTAMLTNNRQGILPHKEQFRTTKVKGVKEKKENN